ncbi:hypothetical protein BCR36DRAFT_344807 [Piromyces finnis]|uniref:Uncharacterized protein n=1 Tax=Piromyces finnis TaxID=1754191 RepID=A0A1Y1VJM8_9FUNG|nr:hypothetical protein BCR36DRAFT_344807 [Piromyces finnis]|eukprot:ORX57920.1 hypothetical protein BCR36DRAFT_344807 [Piromyces finnis]
MSVEIEQKDEEVYRTKKADKLREYYFPSKEVPSQQETEKVPRQKRPSVISSVDPTQLPQVNYSTLGIDIDQLDSTISFNVESFVNDTLGEFGWNNNHDLELGQNLDLDFKLGQNEYLDNQCLEMIQKAYRDNTLSVRSGKIIDSKGTTDSVQLERIQNDFDSLKIIIETVETIIPKSQMKNNLVEFCNKINKPDCINEYNDICDAIRDLSPTLKQIENNYIENNSENEAFALIAFYKLKQMELIGITNDHLRILNEAIDAYESKINPKESEKLSFIKKFSSFINEHLSS